MNNKMAAEFGGFESIGYLLTINQNTANNWTALA